MRILTVLFLFSLFGAVGVQASGKKKPPVVITFHFEATGREGKKLSVPVQTKLGKRYISKLPAFSTKDFIAYYPFVSPHKGEGYGVSLQLNKIAAKRLRSLSAQHKGRYIIASVNGCVVDMLYIDKQVDGRVITIWRGIDPKFITHVNHVIPRIGETQKQWKARLKAEKKAARTRKKK